MGYILSKRKIPKDLEDRLLQTKEQRLKNSQPSDIVKLTYEEALEILNQE